MRVLAVITRGDAIGGAQIHVRDLCRELQRAGVDLLVVTGSQGHFTRMLDGLGMRWMQSAAMARPIHPRRDAAAIADLRRIVASFKPDVVAAHTTKAGILARIASRVARVPCVVNPHGWAFAEGVPEPGRTAYKMIEAGMARLADRIICVSDDDRHLALRSGLPGRRLVTIHNGVPDVPADLRANPDSREADANSPVRIVCVARFDPPKDHRLLLRAMSSVSNATLDLIGEGRTLEAIRAESIQLGIAERVHFLGYRSDVPAVLARSHVFVLASRWEGFPLATIEAMRAGLPVVVTDVGGSREAITEGENGFLVPRGDADCLSDRLRNLVSSPERRASLGRAARRRYEEAFTVERMADRTRAVYESAIASRRSRQA